MSKKEEIIELIQLTNLQPGHLDVVIPNFVKTAVKAHGKETNIKEVVEIVKKKITNVTFIEEFVPSFDKAFTSEEIKFLLDFYKSPAMKKFSRVGKDLLSPLYKGFNKIILDMLKQ